MSKIASATQPLVTSSSSVADGVSVLPALAQVGATLLFVIALIVISAWCVKRFNFRGLSQRGPIKIESALALGQKEKMLVVNVEGKRLLIGVTAHNISVLDNDLNSHIEEERAQKPEKASSLKASDAQQDFASHLKTMLGWKANNVE